jgi:hypothetical protein
MRIQTVVCACFEIKNPGTFVPGLFFVAESDEISNLYLIKDIDKLIKFMEVSTCKKNHDDQDLSRYKRIKHISEFL